MIAPKAQKQPKQNTVVAPKSSGNVMARPDAPSPQNKISKRAYELYESRGREPGQDQQDWLRAEQEILKA